jgi:hypothetical protein
VNWVRVETLVHRESMFTPRLRLGTLEGGNVERT